MIMSKLTNIEECVGEFRNDFVEEDRTSTWVDQPFAKIERWLTKTLKELTQKAYERGRGDERVQTLKDIEEIAVKTNCNYGSAITRFMSHHDIKEEQISPTKNNE